MHSLLSRQLKKLSIEPQSLSEPCGDFLAAVDAAYHDFDVERSLIERSLEISSEEMLQDISQRQSAEEQLANAVALLQGVLESTADGIAVLNNQREIVRFNRKFVEMWRIPDALMLTRDADRLLEHAADQLVSPEEFRAKAHEVHSRALDTLVDILAFKDGRIYERIARPNFVDGEYAGHVLIFHDITSQKKAEEALRRSESQLRQSQKMEAVGRLAGGVAHDFNNILTAIIGYSKFLADALPSDSQLFLDVAEIRKSADRAAALTSQLLAFSRKQVLRPIVLDLNSVVSQMESMLRRLIGEHVELKTSLRPGLEQVKADQGQLEQVIMNLVINARDAMPNGGLISIETSEFGTGRPADGLDTETILGPGVLLTVSDTGTGIDAAVLSHIFEPFFTTKELGKGTGLGLSTVYGIIQQSGGQIGVVSAPGQGTRFSIFLPSLGLPAAEQAFPALARPRITGSETILLVEDEDGVRQFVSRSLRRDGYLVLEARHGQEALRLCQEHAGAIHLLVTDVVMPGMNGRVLCERVISCRPGVKVLYVSGYTADIIAEHGVLDPDLVLLHKPFTPEALGVKVREVLDAAEGSHGK